MGGKSMGLMGGKSMGGLSSGLSGFPSKSMSGLSGMGGKSMGGLSGLSGVPTGLSGFPSKSMGMMGGKSMGLMGGKSMGGLSGLSGFDTKLSGVPSGLGGFQPQPLRVPNALPASLSKFACPQYSFWASHKFHCMPPKDLYCYSVQFNRAWCTTQYYAHILVDYPKCISEKKCEPEKKDLDAVIVEITKKLLEARKKIEIEMKSHSESFVIRINQVHEAYIQAMECYLARCYKPDSYTYCQMVASYKAELEGAKIHATCNLETAVRLSLTKVEAFHAQLISTFRACLMKRIKAVSEFSLKIEHSAVKCLTQYRTALQAVMTKKITFVTSAFEKLYAGKTKPTQFVAFIECFKKDLQTKLEADLKIFKEHVETILIEIKDCYRCNFKCLIRSGCYQFSKKSFSRTLVKIPSPPKIDCKLVSVKAFQVDWNGCVYNNLKKASADDKCEFDHQKHLDAIAAKVTQLKAELAAKIALWKTKTETWDHCAITSLTVVVHRLMPKTYCGRVPTQCEIDTCRANAMVRAKNWITIKKKELSIHIEAVEKQLTMQIDAWKINAEKYILKVKAQFDQCVAQKTVKITSFKELLEKTKVSQRAHLLAQLNSMALAHKAEFEKFFLAAFGGKKAEGVVAEVKAHYLKCVEEKVQKIMAKFDKWWKDMEPKLIEHQACGLKCVVKVTTPCMKLHYSWTWCAPSLKECRFF